MALASFSPAICLRCRYKHPAGTKGTCPNTVRPIKDGRRGPAETCGGMLVEVLVDWPTAERRAA